MPDRQPRAPRPQIVLEVLRREQLSPHLVRLHLGGEGFDSFAPNGFTDAYVKIHFAKPALGLEPPYDLDALRETLAPEDLPVRRTYTVRAVDPVERSLAIDFVVHGTEGIAGPWADAAKPGDRLVLAGPGGAYRPDPTADWHLFAGDESALPALSSALEALPAEARGVALVEVHGEGDEIPVTHPAGVELRWLHRGSAVAAGTSTVLSDAVRGLERPSGRVQVFAHGERETMKALRDIVLTQWGLPRTDVSLSGYWAYGRTEDRFQAEKREPIGQILPR
ncbi:NADPH-dependent ferric siderophore reductase [Cnuibacter physcomitrellae]|uniref:NADPH-dependent ferric siderophore reductase n=1 Tax=Cnuibacter physcomitrellae TaxID=1619308 RepID=A0A1X9LMK7_9MICO|nr:siderophore-interacting protein [Cnuibacter physcomitrellae]ARJ04349.1 NADPH-dependent ferric siderophore reductase [Cnuibacter physcomitrellae]